VRVATPPALAVLPLDQHAGSSAIPLVSVGDPVLLCQAIAGPGSEPSSWLHSPVSGKVIAIEPRATSLHRGVPSTCIVIENDGQDRRDDVNAASLEFHLLAPAALRDLIERGGIVGLGGAMFPTAVKLSLAARSPKRHVLLNGAECEPYISCDYMLMRERANDVVLGARILLHAVEAEQCTIALEDEMPAAEQSLRSALEAARDARIRIVTVPSVYPAGGELQLIASVFGLEVPAGGLPQDVGVLCQNVGTAAAVARWVRDREPLVSRIVTITGSGIARAANLEARIGTPIASLVKDCGGYTNTVSRLIAGGSMMGVALPHDDMPLMKGSNCIIAASTEDLGPRGPEMPCIRCGECSRVCPAVLLPQQLHWHALARDSEALERYGLMDCIECGCCDYVCPSQIPLTDRFRDAKPVVAARIASRARATAARADFEAREARVSRLEAEREAQLQKKRREAGGG
jgi:electron transport complex protein RnfC